MHLKAINRSSATANIIPSITPRTWSTSVPKTISTVSKASGRSANTSSITTEVFPNTTFRCILRRLNIVLTTAGTIFLNCSCKRSLVTFRPNYQRLRLAARTRVKGTIFLTNRPQSAKKSGSFKSLPGPSYAKFKRPQKPHCERQVDAQNYLGDEDGGRQQTAPRAGNRRSRPSLCRAYGAHAGVAVAKSGDHRYDAAADCRHRQGRYGAVDRHDLRPWLVGRLQPLLSS